MIIAIDFDGTIVEHMWPEIGPLRTNAVEVIRRLNTEGHRILIWTCRTSQILDRIQLPSRSTVFHAKEFLDDHGIPYHAINNNDPRSDFQPSPKIYADLYIDDKQLGGLPDDWEDIYKMIHS